MAVVVVVVGVEVVDVEGAGVEVVPLEAFALADWASCCAFSRDSLCLFNSASRLSFLCSAVRACPGAPLVLFSCKS